MSNLAADALYYGPDGETISVKRLVNNPNHEPQWLVIDLGTNKNLLLPDRKSYIAMMQLWESNGWHQVIEVPWTTKVMLVPINARANGNTTVRFVERGEL